MHRDETTPLSAQVLLRSATGAPLRGDRPITTESLGAHQPSEAAINAVQRAFAEAGFEIGPFVGISFSITAPPRRFEESFGVRISARPDGAIEVLRNDEPSGIELPLDGLAPELAERVETVTFTPPAELLDEGDLLDF